MKSGVYFVHKDSKIYVEYFPLIAMTKATETESAIGVQRP